MSTYFHLQCDSHYPPLRSHDEVGQHLYDLPNIRKVVTTEWLESDIDAFQYDSWADPWDAEKGYFHINAVKFLVEHPECPISIWDEYGVKYPVKEDPVPSS